MSETRTLHGWGRTAPSRARVTVPAGADAVARALREAPARGAIARGLGRSYGDAAQNAGGLVLDMTALDRIRSFDAETGLVEVEAGCPLDALLRLAVPQGWFPAVTPGTRFVTVGGALAADVHGKNHHRDGAFARHLRALTLLTPGGETLELAPGSPELEATAGGLGLTGVVLACTLQLVRIESRLMLVDVERTGGLDETFARLEATDGSHRYSVAWLDGTAAGARLGRAVLMQGDHAPAGVDGARERPRPLPLPLPSRSPVAPLLRSPAVAAFNELHFRRAREGHGRRQSIDAFFYPLDAIAGWNRLYGGRGFVQYQFVVPPGAEDTVRRVLERLRRARPTLIVIKRFGAEAGPLSFPMPGWTLAIDVAAGAPELARLLDACDAEVAAAGGRVYLAKDARLRPDLLAAMYPRLPEWRAVQERLDPDGRMQCDLARRLGLTGR